MSDDDAEFEVEVEDIVEPAPWTIHDTAAVVFEFASNVATSASEMFTSLQELALGAAGYWWKRLDAAEFKIDANKFIQSLTEGDNNG